jgi:hypothetical protein
MVGALERNFNDRKNLTPSYALLGRIRIGSSRQVSMAVEEVMKLIYARLHEPDGGGKYNLRL